MWLLVLTAQVAQAQPSLSYAQPAAVLPNGMTRVTLHGDKLTAPLRVWTSAALQVNVVELAPQKAVLDVSPAAGSLPLGSFGLCVATG